MGKQASGWRFACRGCRRAVVYVCVLCVQVAGRLMELADMTRESIDPPAAGGSTVAAVFAFTAHARFKRRGRAGRQADSSGEA